MSKTPELDKMLAVKEKSQVVGEFLEWLNEQKIVLAEYTDDTCDCGCDCEEELLLHIRKGREQLLADFFEINLDKCEQERQQILADLRSDGR